MPPQRLRDVYIGSRHVVREPSIRAAIRVHRAIEGRDAWWSKEIFGYVVGVQRVASRCEVLYERY